MILPRIDGRAPFCVAGKNGPYRWYELSIRTGEAQELGAGEAGFPTQADALRSALDILEEKDDG